MVVSRVNRHVAAWMVLAIASVIAGCSDGDAGKSKLPTLGTVKGTIKLDDKPLPNAQVEFTTPQARGSSGRTDSNGVYTLDYDQSHKGAAVGDHTVRITTKMEAGTQEQIPAKYNDKSELKATVKAGDQTIDFSIQSK